MKQISLRGIERLLEERIREEARRQGKSVNKTIIFLLRKATNLEPADLSQAAQEFHDLDRLAGTWSSRETKAFNRALAKIRKLDGELWK